MDRLVHLYRSRLSGPSDQKFLSPQLDPLDLRYRYYLWVLWDLKRRLRRSVLSDLLRRSVLSDLKLRLHRLLRSVLSDR